MSCPPEPPELKQWLFLLLILILTGAGCFVLLGLSLYLKATGDG